MVDHQEPKDDDTRSAARGPIIVPFVKPVVGPHPTQPAGTAPFRSERDGSAVGAKNGGPFASTAVVVSPSVSPSGGPFTERARLRAAAAPAKEPTRVEPLPRETRERGPSEEESRQPGSNDVISDTIRRWARPTTLDELKSRGIRRVRSISMARVGSLLEKAVNRALIERTLESDRGEALSLSSTAREQFVRLSQVEITGEAPAPDPEVAEEVPLHERATSTLDRLKRELEDRRKVVADREKQLTDGDLDKAEENRVGNQMRELFATHAGIDDRLLEREVLGLVFGELRTSRRRARLARLEEHQREIGVLERRVAKLSVLLGETEDALRKVRAAKHIDAGLSSIYDEVQGLGTDDEQYEQKSDLMRSLFEANLALRS